MLVENGIVYEIEEYHSNLPAVYVGGMMTDVTTVKLRKADFQKVEKLLTKQAKDSLREADENHYLYSFSNDELIDLISKPDEWNEFDYQLAKNILNNRGVEVNDVMLLELKDQRLRELSEPEPRQTWLVLLGYLVGVCKINCVSNNC